MFNVQKRTSILDILDVPVLRRMLFAALDRHDLVQCALVSKAWHCRATPVLWTTILDLSLTQQASFQQLVLENYRAAIAMNMRERLIVDLLRNNEQTVRDYHRIQQQLLQSGCDDTSNRLCALMEEESDEILELMARYNVERFPQMQQHLPPTALGKYGSCIRTTPDVPTLLKYLWPWTDTELSLQNVRQGYGGRAPSNYDMLRHFLQKCPHVRFPSLVITQAFIDDEFFLDDLVKLVLPLVQNLVLDSLSLSFSDLRKILEVPRGLHSLDINICRISLGEEELGATIGDIHWSKIGLLSLTISIQDQNQAAEFWSGLWRDCTNVQYLRIIRVAPGMVAALTRDAVEHMPYLKFLDLGYETDVNSKLDFSDEEIAAVLFAGTDGWRSIQLRDTAAMGHRSLAVLTQHYATLNVLECCWSFRGEHLVDILSWCPNLTELKCQIEDVREAVEKRLSPITVEQFFDWDEKTHSYRPWACESALQNLRIVFADLDQGDDRWELHAMLYGRLARLTQLEVLHLGTVGESQLPSCGIAMTLESGLSKLAGLIELRTLDLSYMVHHVKVRELEWMVGHWPYLTSVKGLDPQEETWIKNILKIVNGV